MLANVLYLDFYQCCDCCVEACWCKSIFFVIIQIIIDIIIIIMSIKVTNTKRKKET